MAMTTSTTPTTLVRPADLTLSDALRLAMIFAAAKLLLQFALTLWTLHLGYSYFRDEFYYIACGRHLAWGYVDHGPIVALQARLGELLFGDSVFGIRVLSAAAGALPPVCALPTTAKETTNTKAPIFVNTLRPSRFIFQAV